MAIYNNRSRGLLGPPQAPGYKPPTRQPKPVQMPLSPVAGSGGAGGGPIYNTAAQPITKGAGSGPQYLGANRVMSQTNVIQPGLHKTNKGYNYVAPPGSTLAFSGRTSGNDRPPMYRRPGGLGGLGGPSMGAYGGLGGLGAGHGIGTGSIGGMGVQDAINKVQGLIDTANQKTEERYNQALGISDTIHGQRMGLAGQISTAAQDRMVRDRDTAVGGVKARLAGSGLGNSNLLPGMVQRTMSDWAIPISEAGDQGKRMQMDLLGDYGNQKIGLIASRNDIPPELGLYAQLLSQPGATGDAGLGAGGGLGAPGTYGFRSYDPNNYNYGENDDLEGMILQALQQYGSSVGQAPAAPVGGQMSQYGNPNTWINGDPYSGRTPTTSSVNFQRSLQRQRMGQQMASGGSIGDAIRRALGLA